MSVLEELVDRLARDSADVVPLLRPPREVPASVPGLDDELVLTKPIRDLYAWHDGTEDVGGTAYRLFPLAWWFPPFDEAMAYLEEGLDALSYSGELPYWRASWFPVFRSGMDAMAVDCSDPAGSVWYSSIATGEALYLAPSLDELIRRVIRRFQTGEFYVENGRVSLVDEDIFEIELLKQD